MINQLVWKYDDWSVSRDPISCGLYYHNTFFVGHVFLSVNEPEPNTVPDAGYLVRYELGDDESPSRGMLAALDAAGADLERVPPLAESVDPDALDKFVTSAHHRSDSPVRVSVSVWDFDVTVTADVIVVERGDRE